MTQLCVWMCAPGARSSVAKPMIWLYLRSGSPCFTARVRILCPGGTRVADATSPSTLVPGRMSMRATTTLSAGCSRMVSGAAIVISSARRRVLAGDAPLQWHVMVSPERGPPGPHSQRLSRALAANGIDGGTELANIGFAQRSKRCTHAAPGDGIVAAQADQGLHRRGHGMGQHGLDHGIDARLLDAVEQRLHQAGYRVQHAADRTGGAERHRTGQESLVTDQDVQVAMMLQQGLSIAPVAGRILHAGDLLREGFLQAVDQLDRQADRGDLRDVIEDDVAGTGPQHPEHGGEPIEQTFVAGALEIE